MVQQDAFLARAVVVVQVRLGLAGRGAGGRARPRCLTYSQLRGAPGASEGCGCRWRHAGQESAGTGRSSLFGPHCSVFLGVVLLGVRAARAGAGFVRRDRYGLGTVGTCSRRFRRSSTAPRRTAKPSETEASSVSPLGERVPEVRHAFPECVQLFGEVAHVPNR